jgi:hypothetical protein
MDHPRLTLDQLAAITDEQQITDIRAAEVALATFDVWRQSPAWNRHEKHYQRWSVPVDRVALVLAELPTDTDLRTVIDARRSAAQLLVAVLAGAGGDLLGRGRPAAVLHHVAAIPHPPGPDQYRAGTLRRFRTNALMVTSSV